MFLSQTWNGKHLFILLARHIFKILVYYHMGRSFLQNYYESYVRDKQWFFCNLGFHKLSQDHDRTKSISFAMPNMKALKRLVAVAWIMQLFVQMLQQSVHTFHSIVYPRAEHVTHAAVVDLYLLEMCDSTRWPTASISLWKRDAFLPVWGINSLFGLRAKPLSKHGAIM